MSLQSTTAQSIAKSNDNEPMTWHGIVDTITSTDPQLIGFAPTSWHQTPIDGRDIVSLNGGRMDVPVPVDFLGNPRARDNPNVAKLEETLLDVYQVCHDGKTRQPTRDELLFDAAKFVDEDSRQQQQQRASER